MRRKKQMAGLADALGIEPESSPFAATDTLPADPEELVGATESAAMEEMVHPPGSDSSEVVGFAGLDVAAELEKTLSTESKDDKLAIYDNMSPKAKEIFLATYQPDPLKNILQNDPMFIDKKAVPDRIILHWISRWVASEIGWRGFLPVPNDARSAKWAPNAKVHPSQRFVMLGRMVLTWRDKSDHIGERLRELKETNAAREDVLKQFAPALRSRHADLGITKEEAETLEALQGGLLRTRGPDPQASPTPDLNKGVGEQ